MKNMKDKIKKIAKLDRELDVLVENEKKEIEKIDFEAKSSIKRDGKWIEITNAELFHELKIVGLNSDAAEIFAKSHPSFIEAIKQSAEKAQELHTTIRNEFDLDPQAMSPAKLIKFITDYVDYKLKEK